MHLPAQPFLRALRAAASVLIALTILWLGAAAYAAESRSSGFRDLTYRDTDRQRAIPIALWYPTAEPSSSVTYGRVHQGQAATGAGFAPGSHPLVLLSHGSGGNRFNHFHIAEYLAIRGYIVAGVEHPGDRTFDREDFGTARNLYNRARDLGFALDSLLADQAIGAHVDAGRIGALGHSAGGFAAIVAAGARPKLANLIAYCRAQIIKSLTCPEQTPRPADEAPEHIAFVEGGVDLTDERIKVAAVFAPAIGPMFDPAGLAAIDVPVQIFWAGRDEILNEPANSRFYVGGIRNVVERPMPTIGHFGFLSICSDLLRQHAPTICADPPGVSRAAFHRTLLSELSTFLDRHLKRAR